MCERTELASGDLVTDIVHVRLPCIAELWAQMRHEHQLRGELNGRSLSPVASSRYVGTIGAPFSA